MVRIGPHKNAISLEVTHEAWLVVGSLAVSLLLIRTDIIASIVVFAADFTSAVSFVIGILFTSILTTTPAIIALAELSSYVPAWKLALIGGAGAVCGDVMIFRFVRSPLVTYIVRTASHPWMVRLGRTLAKGPFWWVIPALGAVIIASPLPDELGLIMMGLSHIRTATFIALSFTMNAAGIFAIATAAQALLQ
jgi:hypothetical protein